MDETMDLIRRAHAGDEEAREQLVMGNVGLVWSIVRRFQNRGVEPEDLFQIGTIGLIRQWISLTAAMKSAFRHMLFR